MESYIDMITKKEIQESILKDGVLCGMWTGFYLYEGVQSGSIDMIKTNFPSPLHTNVILYHDKELNIFIEEWPATGSWHMKINEDRYKAILVGNYTPYCANPWSLWGTWGNPPCNRTGSI